MPGTVRGRGHQSFVTRHLFCWWDLIICRRLECVALVIVEKYTDINNFSGTCLTGSKGVAYVSLINDFLLCPEALRHFIKISKQQPVCPEWRESGSRDHSRRDWGFQTQFLSRHQWCSITIRSPLGVTLVSLPHFSLIQRKFN